MMATADACKVPLSVPFTYLWTIENVPKLTPIDIKSPRFVAHSIRKETWHLQIAENEVAENAENCFCCWLRGDEETLQTDDENLLQEISSIVIEFSLLGDDGSTLISKKSEESRLYVNLLTSAAFLERRAELIRKNKLTVQFRMWKRGCEVLIKDFCYGRTKLMPYRRSFIWAIVEFSALHSISAEGFESATPDEIKVYTLNPFSSRWPSMVLILFLTQSYGLENVNVHFVTGEGRDLQRRHRHAFGCEMSILDANGKVIVFKVENGCLNKILKFCSLISRSELIANKNLLVPNDTLLLRCSLEIPFGNILSRIEYCTPNVSTGVPPTSDSNLPIGDLHFAAENNPLEFEEYLINKKDENDTSNMEAESNPFELEDDPFELEDDPFELEDDLFYGYISQHFSKQSKNIKDSCRDSCTLRAALKHLHGNPTLSDISLKLGTKRYLVHSNVLCSRSPVFRKILNSDIVQKTFEIEDMDGNTLRRLLQYIYTDTVEDLDFPKALDLYKAAGYYQLLDLRNKCSEFLGNNLLEDNFCEIQSLANKCQDEELEKKVRDAQESLRLLEFTKQLDAMNFEEILKSTYDSYFSSS